MRAKRKRERERQLRMPPKVLAQAVRRLELPFAEMVDDEKSQELVCEPL